MLAAHSLERTLYNSIERLTLNAEFIKWNLSDNFLD